MWHENGTREAFLMHLTAVLDAIKKRGHFLNYEKAEKVHKEAKKAVESARAGLSLLDGTGTKSKRFCKKKAREAAEKALAKAQPLKDKILTWQNILYQVLDMSTQYNILYYTTQYIAFNKKFIFSFEKVYIVITKKFILSNKLRLF